MSNITGTPKRVTLDGISYDVMADANFSQVKGSTTNEEVVTSGKIVKKMTKRAEKVESVNIQANSEEAEELKALSNRKTNFPMSYELASGDVFRCVGFINFESHDTESGVAAIQMIPESTDGWAPFLA